jgi:hypothetical protein
VRVPTTVIDMYAALPNAELAIVPGTSHFLTQQKPDLVNKMVVDFLTTRAGANGRAHPPSAQARGQSWLAAALAYPGADVSAPSSRLARIYPLTLPGPQTERSRPGR